LDENFSRLITTFDEVPRLLDADCACVRFASRPGPAAYDKGVDLKRRPPKSRPAAPRRRHYALD